MKKQTGPPSLFTLLRREHHIVQTVLGKNLHFRNAQYITHYKEKNVGSYNKERNLCVIYFPIQHLKMQLWSMKVQLYYCAQSHKHSLVLDIGHKRQAYVRENFAEFKHKLADLTTQMSEVIGTHHRWSEYNDETSFKNELKNRLIEAIPGAHLNSVH